MIVPMSTLLMKGALRSLLNDSDAEMIITNQAFAETVNKIKPDLPNLRPGCCLTVDTDPVEGFQNYHSLADEESTDEGV